MTLAWGQWPASRSVADDDDDEGEGEGEPHHQADGDSLADPVPSHSSDSFDDANGSLGRDAAVLLGPGCMCADYILPRHLFDTHCGLDCTDKSSQKKWARKPKRAKQVCTPRFSSSHC